MGAGEERHYRGARAAGADRAYKDRDRTGRALIRLESRGRASVRQVACSGARPEGERTESRRGSRRPAPSQGRGGRGGRGRDRKPMDRNPGKSPDGGGDREAVADGG